MKLVILSGIAAAGKDTILKELISQDSSYKRVVNCTTRKPRAGEIDGVDYYFISQEQHKENLKENRYLTSNDVHGRDYGTLASELADSKISIGHFGTNDINQLINNKDLDLEVIFVVVDFHTWHKRMEERLENRFITKDELILRARNAIPELIFAINFILRNENARVLNNNDLKYSLSFLKDNSLESDTNTLESLLANMIDFLKSMGVDYEQIT